MFVTPDELPDEHAYSHTKIHSLNCGQFLNSIAAPKKATTLTLKENI